MASYTDPRTGESIPEELTREPIRPPPGEFGDRLATPSIYPTGPSTNSILIGVLALVAIVFVVFMSMDRGPATPPSQQQSSENIEPAPIPPAPPSPPAPTVQ